MKKILSLVTVITFIILIPACNDNSGTGETSNAGPKEVLHDFFEKMGQRDFDGAAELATKSSKPTLDLMKQTMTMMKSYNQGDDTGRGPSERFKDVEIGEARIDGDNAFVPYKHPADSIEVDFPLKKENGAWKVDFSMATMMKMGIDQARKRGMIDDSTNLQDIQDKMKQGMQMRDSMMKKLDPKQLEEMQKIMDKAQQQ